MFVAGRFRSGGNEGRDVGVSSPVRFGPDLDSYSDEYPALVEKTDDPNEVSTIQEELMTPGPGRQPVEFAIDAPDAETVTLEMVANYWAEDPRETIELFRVDDERGSHAVTLHLGSDAWRYRFRVDGVWTSDPSNPLGVAAPDGQEVSLVVVGESLPELVEQPDIAAGTVREHMIPAGVIGDEQALVVYTPPGYTEQQRYPLLVLLHGGENLPSNWVDALAIDHAMDNLIAADEVVPFVIAMPTANEFGDVLSTHVMDEVIPYLQDNYSLASGPGSTAIGGYSLGGHGTLELAYRHPDRFGLAMPIMMAALSCGLTCDDVGQYDDEYPEGFDVEFAMWTGANDEYGVDANHDLFAVYLDERGVPYEHHVDTSDGHYQDGHSLRYVRTIIADVLLRASEHFSS